MTDQDVPRGPGVAEAAHMSRARQVLARQFYLITRSCTQRQFLLRPDDETNNAFVYCLAEAAARHDITVVLPMAESNHHHTVIYDEFGKFPAFMEHFHKMLARCMNARWGRWENMWAAEEPCATRLLDRDAVIEALIYSASNPVKDLLVQHAHQWPGTNGYRNLLNGKPLTARRPRHFFRENGKMPASVTLQLTIPEALGDADEVIAAVRAGVEAEERRMLEHRAKTGKRILGVKSVLAASWKSSPDSVRPHRTLRPRFAGGIHVRISALTEYKLFLAAYAYARRLWLIGKRVAFPEGTYWLARHAPVTLNVPLTA